MEYRDSWDLSTIPDDKLLSERGRRSQAARGPQPNAKLEPCKHCGTLLTARQRRAACISCGRSQRR